jgi:hypothetical protein
MLRTFGFVLRGFGFVLRMERVRMCVQRLVLCVNGGRVCLERGQMCPKLVEIRLVIGRIELRAMKLVEFLHQLRMSSLQLPLLARELSGV